MLLKHLQYLVALASERHFAHAAERCAITQPTLSLALRTLEDDLGVPIVERGNRFLGFTPQGEIVLGWARRLLADESNLRQELDLANLTLRGKLRIGVIPSAIALVPSLTNRMLALHPLVDVEELEMSSIEIVRKLAAYEIDVGITYLDNEPLDHVLVRSIALEEYVLVAPVASPVAVRATMTWREAAELPLCLLYREMQHRRIVDGVFETAGVRPNVKIETNSLMSTIFHVRAGSWSTIVPRSFAESLGTSRIIVVASLVEPEIRKSVGLVVAARDPIPALVAAFFDLADANAPVR